MQPANPRFLPMLIMVIATFALPSILLVPTAVAVGVPMLLSHTYQLNAGLLYLSLSFIQFILTVALYIYILKFQGFWLWSRESKILDIVANVPE